MKKIDSYFIQNSQILCEFWNTDRPVKQVGFLDDVHEDVYRAIGCSEIWYDNYRVYYQADYWISNVSGKLQLPEGLICKCKTSDGEYFLGETGLRGGDSFVYRGTPKIMSGAELSFTNTTREHAIENPAKYATNQWWLDERIHSVQILGLAKGYEW